MKADKLTKKQINAIFDNSVKQAVIPPRFEAKGIEKPDKETLDYAHKLREELRRKWGLDKPLDK